MVTKKVLLETLETIAPSCTCEAWDNCGIQVFTGGENVDTVLTALEATPQVIREAVDRRADWIVSHHPLFFDAIRSLDVSDPAGEAALLLIQNGISLYAAHTSFDNSPHGNNEYLAGLLGLGLERDDKIDCIPHYLYISKPLKAAVTFDRLLKELKNALEIDSPICHCGLTDRDIERIAICCGAGGSCVREAHRTGCDVLITGDLKYHDAQIARQMGIAVIDAGHYHTEKTFARNMADRLESALGEDVVVIPSKTGTNPFDFWNF